MWDFEIPWKKIRKTINSAIQSYNWQLEQIAIKCKCFAITKALPSYGMYQDRFQLRKKSPSYDI